MRKIRLHKREIANSPGEVNSMKNDKSAKPKIPLCDYNILVRLSQNDPIAFKIFYKAYYQTVLRYTSYFEMRQDLRNDIVSDVFIQMWNSRSSICKIENLENYLFIVVRNKILTLKKEEIANLKISLDSCYDLADDSVPDGQQDLEKKELESAVKDTVSRLPKRCKLIYLMVRNEGMKYKEVAEMLSISKRTVHAQMVIAGKRIGETIKKYIRGTDDEAGKK